MFQKEATGNISFTEKQFKSNQNIFSLKEVLEEQALLEQNKP